MRLEQQHWSYQSARYLDEPAVEPWDHNVMVHYVSLPRMPSTPVQVKTLVSSESYLPTVFNVDHNSWVVYVPGSHKARNFVPHIAIKTTSHPFGRRD